MSSRRRPLLLLPILLCLASCAGDAGVDVEPDAAPVPDASTVGCQDSCDGQSPDGCWCDDTCATRGDCCDDYQSVCTGPAPSCRGLCGDQSPDGCWCDDTCATRGDCCDDYQSVCARPGPSCQGSCGGQSPDGCWCNEQCTERADCCDDYDAVCESSEPFPGLSDDALLAALRGQATEGHEPMNYFAARDRMYGLVGSGIDIVNGKVEGVYTGELEDADGTRTPGGRFNTEHSWPRADGAGEFPIEGDIHHLFPSLASANERRGSYEFGVTVCVASNCLWNEGGSELGVDTNARTVFEVRPLRRGDIARAHFYISMRYELAIFAQEETTLRAWHEQDPPDSRERARNDGIEAAQGNRNPFIDEPDLVDRISNF